MESSETLDGAGSSTATKVDDPGDNTQVVAESLSNDAAMAYVIFS
jgi:hypothetical protein